MKIAGADLTITNTLEKKTYLDLLVLRLVDSSCCCLDKEFTVSNFDSRFLDRYTLNNTTGKKNKHDKGGRASQPTGVAKTRKKGTVTPQNSPKTPNTTPKTSPARLVPFFVLLVSVYCQCTVSVLKLSSKKPPKYSPSHKLDDDYYLPGYDDDEYVVTYF